MMHSKSTDPKHQAKRVIVHARNSEPAPRHGLARALSKRGFCSRTQAAEWIKAGRVRVNGKLQTNPEYPTTINDEIAIDNDAIAVATRRVLMLNKPKGHVTTRSDEKGRKTVYDLLPLGVPWLAPIGRLDQASEGLLLFTNDPEFAARITAPESGVMKTYHVQLDCIPSDEQIQQWRVGVLDHNEKLQLPVVRMLRKGERNAWVEIVLHEGRNRHIRRVMAACGIVVLRLMRVAIADLALGDLAKQQSRWLTDAEVQALDNALSN